MTAIPVIVTEHGVARSDCSLGWFFGGRFLSLFSDFWLFGFVYLVPDRKPHSSNGAHGVCPNEDFSKPLV
ncbi:MAG: hypothetical protein ABIR56_17845 [Polaromonas sp.]